MHGRIDGPTAFVILGIIFLTALSIFLWLKGRKIRKMTQALEDVDGSALSTDSIEVAVKSSRERTYECGHRDSAWFVLLMYGELSKEIHNKERCSSCLIEHLKPFIIRCAHCRSAITPGAGVALYHRSSPGLHLDIATQVEDQVIGCMRWDCAPTGGVFAGVWTGTEFQPAFPGGQSVAAYVFSTGKTVSGTIPTGT